MALLLFPWGSNVPASPCVAHRRVMSAWGEKARSRRAARVSRYRRLGEAVKHRQDFTRGEASVRGHSTASCLVPVPKAPRGVSSPGHPEGEP